MHRDFIATLLVLAFAGFPSLAQAQLNLYCSSPNTAWCQGMANGFEKATGTQGFGRSRRPPARCSRRSRPSAPIRRATSGGPAPPIPTCRRPTTACWRNTGRPTSSQLYDWAQQITKASANRVAGVYGGILALGYNTEIGDKKKLPVPKCWKDLANPVYKGEVMLGNPSTSGTAYLMLATLVQVFGEDEAFKLMVEVNRNVTSYARSGIGPMTAITRGEVYVGSTVLHGVINEIVRGFPVAPILPCEGVGYEVGSVAIIKGARNLDAAKKFYDWALTAEAQKIGLDLKEFAIPTNRNVVLPPMVPKLTDVKVIDYDFAKYGASETRKRLLERWEKEINSAPK